MSRQKIRPTDEPLTSDDLAICQRVFESVCKRQDVAKVSDEESRVAAITIELYRQGVRSEEHLTEMVSAARGAMRWPD
jgi:hypothetical protein